MWIFFEGQGTWGTRILPPLQLIVYFNDEEKSTSALFPFKPNLTYNFMTTHFIKFILT